MENPKYDAVIIGGGAAGMIAAISAAQVYPDKKIALIDRTFALGRKILVCGAGRCNITNVNLDASIEEHYYGAPAKFIEEIFNQFGFADIVEFFNDLGIELYTERKTSIGKMFPITNQARTVTELLLDEMKRLGIDIFLNTEVKQITTEATSGENQNSPAFRIGCETTEKSSKPGEKLTFKAGKLILSAGGKTYPALGSNGSGYELAESFGHSIIHPVPSALPLESKNPLSHAFQGVKMEIGVTSEIGGKKIKTRSDDVMFTKYGLSGPAILNISRELSIHFNRHSGENAKLYQNFLPEISAKAARELLEKRWRKRPTQSLSKSLYGLLPNKVADVLPGLLEIEANTPAQQLNGNDKKLLLNGLCGYELEITGTRGWNEAEFTAGGIDTNEVSNETLESKLQQGLFFCGEILNVDGDVGGFNLSWSWASGWVAGKALFI